MNDWPHDATAADFRHQSYHYDAYHASVAMEMPPPMDTTHAFDPDALLDALVFMDDLELDATATDAHDATIKYEPPATTSTFTAELQTAFSGIPADAYMPGMLVPASVPTYPSVMNTISNCTMLDSKELSTASQSPSPSPSPSPTSPPASVTSSASPPVSPSTNSETKSTVCSSMSSMKPKGVVNRSRNRRREELHYLRDMVGELEDRLTTLRKRADEQHQHEQRKLIGDSAAPADDPVLTAVWEDLATRQYTQRQRAEVENTKLRRMLEDQIQVGKSLERLLKRRNNTDDVDLHLHGKRPRRSSVSTAWNNAAIFDELLGNLPAMYQELSTVFSTLQFDRGTPNFRDITVRNDPAMGVMIEITEDRVFPFDYELTTQEFWALFLNPTENDRFHYHDTDCGEDVLKVQFGMTVQVPRAQGEFNMKIVSRRYREAHRTVIVWVGFLDPTEISDTNMDGIYMRHKGWNIIEPLAPARASPTPASDSRSDSTSTPTTPTTGMGTRITSYSYSIPEAFEDVPDQKRKVGTLTNFMLSTADVQISARQQQLENRLVELSRAR